MNALGVVTVSHVINNDSTGEDSTNGGNATSEFGGEGADGTRNAGLYGGGGWSNRSGRQGLIRITFEWPSSFFTLGPNGYSQAIVSSTNGTNSFVYQFPDQIIL